ncbi:MAG: hypothetical protein J6A17_04850 [Bacilli bacterium]|nr:hypothetical protein [Bacilli bacterium]
MDKKKITIVYVIATAMILGILGYTYAYFSATVTENNKTETVIKTDELTLVFTGTNEITTGDNMIPGDSFTKTFTVENTSNVDTKYNIYMENITNEFNEDLVYVLSDEDGVVVEETPLPVTNAGKSYLISDIEIASKELKTYTLKIEYKYLDTPQDDYQGATFRGTVGVDANKIENNVVNPEESTTPTKPVELKYYAFGLPDITSTTNYNDVIASSGSNTFMQLDEEQLSVCIYRNNTLECFKNNNYVEEAEHLKQVFGENVCSVESDLVACDGSDIGCNVSSSGNVYCNDKNSGHGCYLNGANYIECK